MTATDIRDVCNHISHFGADAVVKKLGRGWVVSFRSFGPPNVFKRKSDAIDFAARWPAALSRAA